MPSKVGTEARDTAESERVAYHLSEKMVDTYCARDEW